MKMVIDENNQTLKFGLKEWLALGAAFFGPTISFGTWQIQLSNRVLLLEATSRSQTALIEKMADNRDRLVQLMERQDNDRRRIEAMERQSAPK
jgi:hypothetical protein